MRPASEGHAQDGTTETTSSIHASTIHGASAADAAEEQLRCHFAPGALRAAPGRAKYAGVSYLARQACRSSRNRCFDIINVRFSGPQLRFQWSQWKSPREGGTIGTIVVSACRHEPTTVLSRHPCPNIDAINGLYSIHRPCVVHSGLRRTQDVCGFFASCVHRKSTQRASSSVGISW
jgi:hypothetical protein